MKAKSQVITLSVLLLLPLPGVSSARYSGGSGEPNDPYRIATPNDLNDIGNHVEDFNKCFVMVKDIDLAACTGTEFNIIGPSQEGLVGSKQCHGVVANSFVSTDVTGQGRRVGGLAEYNDSLMADSAAAGSVSSNATATPPNLVSSVVGGLVLRRRCK